MSERPSRRRFLAAVAAGSSVVVSGCASIVETVNSSGSSSGSGGQGTESSTQVSGQSTETASKNVSGPSDGDETQTETSWSIDDVSIESPSTSLASITIPDDETDYPTMGDADETLTVYGSWKCPYTQDFVLKQLPGFVDEFVRPGDVSIEFRAVAYRGGDPFLGADAPRASRTGLGVWETDPESFWQYFMYVFANQPNERHRWAKPELLTRFAGAADVEPVSEVRETASDQSANEQLVQQTVESANENDIWTVPRVLYDGEVTAPTLDAESTREQFESAAEE